MTAFDVRLVAYAPNGERLGVVRHPISLAAAMPMCDVSSLRCEVPLGVPGSDLLERPCEIALEVSDGDSGWREPSNARFLRLQWETDPSDPTRRLRVTAPGYAWLLGTGGFNAPSKPRYDEERKVYVYDREFTNATPGLILHTAITDAQAQGLLMGFSVDFSGSMDSAGNPWETTLPEAAYAPGTPVLDVLNALTDRGMVDWRMRGRTLRVFNAGGSGEDLTLPNPPVSLRIGRDITEAPTKGDLSQTVHRAMLRGADGKVFTLNAASNVIAPWGRFQKVQNQGEVTKSSAANVYLNAVLKQGAGEQIEMTRVLRFADTTPRPGIDYGVGDHIFAPNEDGLRERVLVRQITLEKNAEGRVTGNLVLNDRFQEAAVRQARRLAGLTGGASSGGAGGASGASGVVVNPSAGGSGGAAELDKRQPKAPASLAVETEVIFDDAGEPWAYGIASWPVVTESVDGAAMTPGYYELWVREPYRSGSFHKVHWDKENTAAVGPFKCGKPIDLFVRAVSEGGTRSADTSVSVVTATDNEPPSMPTPPRLSTSLGTVRVEWDHGLADGSALPVDFLHVEVWQAGVEEPIAYLTATPGDDFAVVSGAAGAEVAFQFAAVDWAGNKSALTDPVVIRGVGLFEDPDVADDWARAKAELEEADRLAMEAAQTGEVTLDRLTSGDMDAAVAEQIWAAKIAAKKITAEEVIIGGLGDNLLPEGIWRLDNFTVGSKFVTREEVPGGGYAPESMAFRLVKSTEGSADSITLKALPEYRALLDSGNRYRVRVFVKSLAGDFPADAFQFRLTGYGAGEASDGYKYVTAGEGSAVCPEGEWVPIDGTLEVTGSFNSVAFGVEARWNSPVEFLISDPHISLMVDHSLIVEGGILARHIDAEEVWADEAFIGHARVNILEANMVKAEHIKADAINAKHKITGAVVQTAESGRRVRLDNTYGIRGWDGDGNLTLAQNTSDGTIKIIGRIDTAKAFQPGVSLIPVTGTQFEDAGLFIFPETQELPDDRTAGVWVTAPGSVNTSADPAVAGRLRLRGAEGGGVEVRNGLHVQGAMTGTGNCTVQGMVKCSAAVEAGGTVLTQAHLKMGTGGAEVQWPKVALKSVNNVLACTQVYNNTTTAVGANVVITNDGKFWRNSSSARDKVGVEGVPLEQAEKVLDVRLVSFYDRAEVEAYADYLTDQATGGPERDPELVDASVRRGAFRQSPGVIAEEVEAAGLGEFVVYGEDPETGEVRVEGVAYDRLAVALIPVVRDQRDRIRALEAKVAEQEARLAALEARFGGVATGE